jgi:hypothetical protein
MSGGTEMGLEENEGTIKTRSGTWDWKLRELRSWPKSDVTGKRLGFQDPSNAVNRMSLELEMEMEDLSETVIEQLSLVPRKRRFEDSNGEVWIAHPVEDSPTRSEVPIGRVSLHSLAHGVKIVDLPPKRTLGDMKNAELVALV